MKRQMTGNNAYLKELNQMTILDLIRVKRAVSKAELSKLTGLSPTAVGVIVAKLLEKGYILETGTGESKGGRRPVLMELKPDSFYSLGFDIDMGALSLVLLDITSKIVYSDKIEIPTEINALELFKLIINEAERILGEYGIDEQRLLGIGISIPGLIENDHKRIVFAPNLGWKDIDVGKEFLAISSVPVFVENEAMASAICENWIGSCEGISNFICINIKSGIGSGIFTGGKLYRGAGGSAGEVGHVTVDENGPKCGCGNYGCLETMASVRYMVEKARKIIRQGTASSLNSIKEIDSIDIDDIISEARNGDDTSRSILIESARYLGIAISNLVNTLNPSKVILGKEFVKYADIVLDQLNAVVSTKALQYPASKVEIEASRIGGQTSELGAAIIPLKLLFKNQ